MTQRTLPIWCLKVASKENTFICDPDLFYPSILEELGVAKEEWSRYWLEVAFGCMKLDFDVATRMAGAIRPGSCITRYIRADDGRKARWNLTLYKPGHKNWDRLPIQERSREIRAAYKRIRSFVPN